MHNTIIHTNIGDLDLGIQISIDGIFDISPQQSSMMIEINVTAYWTDKNLNYKNLNENGYLNALSLKQKKSIYFLQL